MFSLLEQYQYVKSFQKFHTGVELSVCLSLQFLRFEYLFTLWHLTLVLDSKRKSSITAPAPLTTKLISKQARLNATKSVLVLLLFINYLAINEFGFRIGYEELSRSKRVLSAVVDNTLRDLLNSSYPTKAEFINCFIIHLK